MSAKRLWTVARLELIQRRRTSRWPIVLGVWFGIIGLVTWASWRAVREATFAAGPSLYDVTTFFVLMLGMLVVPSLTATTVNGDREQGVLATMQTTLVTSWELVLGKLLASWIVSMCFLATALPFLAWAWVSGGLSVGRILLSLLVLVLVMAVVAAVGLMFSTLTARPVASAVLTYLSLATLVFGTLIAFLLGAVLLTHEVTIKVHGVPESFWAAQNQPPAEGETPPPDGGYREPTEADCRTFTRTTEESRTDQLWPLLAMNPFVVVADAAPSRLAENDTFGGGFTPMRWISDGSRDAKAGPGDVNVVRDECAFFGDVGPGDGMSANEQELSAAKLERRNANAVWPWGLTFLVALGLGSVVVAERRVRTPMKRLPSGTRIA
ncbi:MAG: ABC transporter permease [Knoellia sp.]